MKNKAGTAVVETGVEVNNLLEVESITLKNARGSTGLTREVDMEFVIKKTSKAITGYDKHVKTYPLTVELKSLPNTVARCHHTLDAKEEGIKEAMCIGLGGAFAAASGSVPSTCSLAELFKKDCENTGGTWDAGTQTCSIVNLFRKNCEDMGGTWDGSKCSVDGLFSQYCTGLGGTPTPGSPIGTCDIASVYVDVAGDTMTGTLSGRGFSCTDLSCTGNIGAGGNVTAANKVIAGGAVTPVTPLATCPTGYDTRPCRKHCVLDPSKCSGCGCGPAHACIRQQTQTLSSGVVCYRCVADVWAGGPGGGICGPIPAGYTRGSITGDLHQ